MTNGTTPTEGTDKTVPTSPPLGLDHPTVEMETTETVEPDYDIVVASEPRTHFNSLHDTKVNRLERVVFTDDVDHFELINAVHDGRDNYYDEYMPGDDFDPLIESVHLRSIDGGELTACVHLRSSFEHRCDLSRLLVAIDECVKELVQPSDY